MYSVCYVCVCVCMYGVMTRFSTILCLSNILELLIARACLSVWGCGCVLYIYVCMQYGNDNETILYSHSTVQLYYVREMGGYDDSMDRETEMRFRKEEKG